MTKLSILRSTKRTPTASKVKKPKKASQFPSWFDPDLLTTSTRHQQALAKRIAGWPGTSAWEQFKTEVHGAVTDRFLVGNDLTITCADGTIHRHSVSRSDRGLVDEYGFHDSGFGSEGPWHRDNGR